MIRRFLFLLLVALAVCSCHRYDSNYSWRHQDSDAKQLLQGLWMDADEGAPAFLADGDSVFFPDTTSMPMRFWIYKDSLYLQGSVTSHYLITKQAEHVLRFVNQSGEEVKLLKSDDKEKQSLCRQERPYALNIFRTLKTDTTEMVHAGCIYDSHIVVEPTSNRVMASLFNEQGLRVDNMYLDNEARVRILLNKKPLYEHNFRKQEFSTYVPKEFLDKSILRNVFFDRADTAAIYLDAVIGVPDATSAFVVEMKISKSGKLTKNLK